jgi:type I restriction enzyme M protein
MPKVASLTPNFGYLITHDAQLVLLGAKVEAFVYTDPNDSITKSRQFIERLVAVLWEAYQLPGNPGRLFDRIQRLHQEGVIPDAVNDLFADVRQTGNSGVHENLDDRSVALRLLYKCYQLGAWFHRTMTDVPEPPAFVPPALPEAQSAVSIDHTELGAQLDEYREELVSMRFTLTEQSDKLDQQAAWAAAESEARAAAEREIRATLQGQAQLRELVRELTDRVSKLQGQLTARVARPAITQAGRDTLVSRAQISGGRILVDRLWHIANLLRDDGLSIFDYLDQLTVLLLFKLAHERSDAASSSPAVVPGRLGWHDLLSATQDQVMSRFDDVIRELNEWDGQTFGPVTNKIRTPATLRAIINVIDGADWSGAEEMGAGSAFDALLTRVGEDYRTGAGQYFTPRALVDVIVDCVAPTVRDTIFDPACGTGGFLVGAYEYIARVRHHELTPDDIEHLADGGIAGAELVADTARLAQMNLFLHGIGRVGGSELIEVRDALVTRPKRRVSLVLSNPPFGRRPHSAIVDKDGHPHRQPGDPPLRSDFWTVTMNRSLNFVQHAHALLRIGGRAAVVVPDNVLFESGAGEVVRRSLLQECDLHTILRLPTGIFYAAGVKANVVFFEKKDVKAQRPCTSRLWVYDFRAGREFSRRRQLRRRDLDDFVAAYRPGQPRGSRTESEWFRMFDVRELLARPKVSLDIV